MAKKNPPLKPLKDFNYALVQPKIDGLLFNIDRDLQRSVKEAEKARKATASRCTELLNVMVRFVTNSYNAAKYIMADEPEDPNRKPKYALILPTVNRQLLDLLFTLVYMMDDFELRSLEYQKAGWREVKEEYQRFRNRFSKDPEWQAFFEAAKENATRLEPILGLTEAERKKPQLIPYWKAPYKLTTQKTKSQPFLKWLEKWLYGDTSAQAHLSFGGLFTVSPFLVAELVGGQFQDDIENRQIHSYRYQQFSRTVIVTLAIATEVDVRLRLHNREALFQLWGIFGEYSAEAREMFEHRHQALLNSYS
jgi:hypothetical protein